MESNTPLIREAAKKVLFLEVLFFSGQSTKGEGGVRGCRLYYTETVKKKVCNCSIVTFFIAVF